GQDDEGDDDRHEQDEQRLDDGGELLGGDRDLQIIGLREAVQHGFELARLLAHGDHVSHGGREDAALLERRADVRALQDGGVQVVEHALQHGVAHDLAHDLDRLQHRHAGLEQRGQRDREARDGLLLEQVAEDRQAQQEAVHGVAPVLGAPQGPDAHVDQDDGQHEQVPVRAQELAAALEDLGGQRQLLAAALDQHDEPGHDLGHQDRDHD